MHPASRRRKQLYLLAVAVCLLAGMLRWRAVALLPPDFDELVYLPASFRYAEMLLAGNWKQVMNYAEVQEHPIFNKLLFATDLAVARPKEPDWNTLDVGKPLSGADRPAFQQPRKVSAVGGTIQVLLTAIVDPLAGLLLALNTYHVKYSAQVYLEGIPGMMAVLAVFLFEIALRRKKEGSDPALNPGLLLVSAIALGVAAAGKYLYGIPGFVLPLFLIAESRSAKPVLLYCVVALAAFFVADPYLWPSPAGRLWNSLTYHWGYAHSAHVVESAMPWYSPVLHLLHAAPTEWHPGVFYTGLADPILLPLSLIGLPRALRERPIWVAWAGFGMLILLLWPTKWPQYILLILPPLCVCAGAGIRQLAAWIAAMAARLRLRSR